MSLDPAFNQMRRPSDEDWESIRPTITQLWYHQNESLATITTLLKEQHNLIVTKKPLKEKLSFWGLRKKWNRQDAEDVLLAEAQMSARGENGIILLRGRVENASRALRYLYRRRNVIGNTLPPQLSSASRTTNVIILSRNPLLRLMPTLDLLSGLESVLRELDLFLKRGKQTSLCLPQNLRMFWAGSTTKSSELETEFADAVWECGRAFRESKMTWSGSCLGLALLKLESLLVVPNLDIWTTFIRGCIQLTRMGAIEMSCMLLKHLSDICHKLPATAAHRPFINALATLSHAELVNGGLFILEAKSRMIEALWPTMTNHHNMYHLELIEERFYNGYDDARAHFPEDEKPSLQNITDMWDYADLIFCRVSRHMLALDYTTAEMLATTSILHLEHYSPFYGHYWTYQTLLAVLYGILGSITFLMNKYDDALRNYLRSLSIHQACVLQHNEPALKLIYIHRVLTVVEWLSTNLPMGADHPHLDIINHQRAIEAELSRSLSLGLYQPFPSIERKIGRSARNGERDHALRASNFRYDAPPSQMDKTTSHLTKISTSRSMIYPETIAPNFEPITDVQLIRASMFGRPRLMLLQTDKRMSRLTETRSELTSPRRHGDNVPSVAQRCSNVKMPEKPFGDAKSPFPPKRPSKPLVPSIPGQD